MVTYRAGKEDNNLMIFLETERMRAEGRERIREEKERIRQEERAEDRRREDQLYDDDDDAEASTSCRTCNPSFISGQSKFKPCEFDGQDTIELELIRRATGV